MHRFHPKKDHGETMAPSKWFLEVWAIVQSQLTTKAHINLYGPNAHIRVSFSNYGT